MSRERFINMPNPPEASLFVRHLKRVVALTSFAGLLSFGAVSPANADISQPTIDQCAANIADPNFTADAILQIIGLTRAELQAGLDSGFWHITLATGSGEFGNDFGQSPDIFCGNDQNNTVPVLDSNASTRDYFFGGAGNDMVMNSYASTFYGGAGNDWIYQADENSVFYGGAGFNSVAYCLGGSQCYLSPLNNFINSISQAKASAQVNFTFPALTAGKYDRVAYSVNGGKWVNWGRYAMSAQYIKGLKLGRTYDVQIRAHVKGGSWTDASDSVSITMKKILHGVIVP